MTPVHHVATEVFTTWVQPGTTWYNHGYKLYIYICMYVMYPLRKVGTALLISFWDKAIGFQLEPENWWRRLKMPELSCWVVEVEITKCTIINLATKTSQAFRAAKTNSAFQLVISLRCSHGPSPNSSSREVVRHLQGRWLALFDCERSSEGNFTTYWLD